MPRIGICSLDGCDRKVDAKGLLQPPLRSNPRPTPKHVEASPQPVARRVPAKLGIVQSILC